MKCRPNVNDPKCNKAINVITFNLKCIQLLRIIERSRYVTLPW